jgi:hypothetical protein
LFAKLSAPHNAADWFCIPGKNLYSTRDRDRISGLIRGEPGSVVELSFRRDGLDSRAPTFYSIKLTRSAMPLAFLMAHQSPTEDEGASGMCSAVHTGAQGNHQHQLSTKESRRQASGRDTSSAVAGVRVRHQHHPKAPAAPAHAKPATQTKVASSAAHKNENKDAHGARASAHKPFGVASVSSVDAGGKTSYPKTRAEARAVPWPEQLAESLVSSLISSPSFTAAASTTTVDDRAHDHRASSVTIASSTSTVLSPGEKCC